MGKIVIAQNNQNISATTLESITTEFSDFASKFIKPHGIGSKDGSYFIRAGGNYRSDSTVLQQSSIIILDGDKGYTEDGEIVSAPSPSIIHNVFKKAGVNHFIYSSHSNNKEENGLNLVKYRVVIESEPYEKDQICDLIDGIFHTLRTKKVLLANVPENKRWSQAWFYPRARPNNIMLYEYYSFLDGRPLNVGNTINNWLKLKPKQVEIQRNALTAKYNGNANPILAFNESFTVEQILLRNGYKKIGERFLHPKSSSGLPGVVILDEKAYSHASDSLNNGHVNNAFDCYRILECSGDLNTALKWNNEINNEYKKQKAAERIEQVITESVVESVAKKQQTALPVNIDDVDLLSPPGLAGEITKYFNSQCPKKRPYLAALASVYMLGCLGGLKHQDEYGIIPNMIFFGIAETGTGKQEIQDLMKSVFMDVFAQPALVGKIKSSVALIRSLIDNQAAFFVMDEIAGFLRNVSNARGGGQAHYLGDTIETIMSIYSSSKSYYLLEPDLKKELLIDLRKDLKLLEKDDFPDEEKISKLKYKIDNLSIGLPNPFLSIFGFNTEESFNSFFTREMLNNGFLNRAIIAVEPELLPPNNIGVDKYPMPTDIKIKLRNIFSGCEHDKIIEFRNPRLKIPNTPDAKKLLTDINDYFHDLSIEFAQTNGCHAICVRGWELTAKVSLALAIPEGTRTVEHVKWAFKLVLWDFNNKLAVVKDNIASSSKDRIDAVQEKIKNLCQQGQSMGILKNRLKRKELSPEYIEQVVVEMEKGGMLRLEGGKYFTLIV